MLTPSPATRIFVALQPADMRRSFNGLSALVEEQLLQDPLSGHLFVFANRRGNRLKILYWDGNGLWCCAKRLERGRFSWPRAQGAVKTLRAEQLTALINGLEVVEKKRWYRR
jgi:transposase